MTGTSESHRDIFHPNKAEQAIIGLLREAGAREIERRGHQESAQLLGLMPAGVESLLEQRWSLTRAVRVCELLELPLTQLLNEASR